jgi:hypothetical protein
MILLSYILRIEYQHGGKEQPYNLIGMNNSDKETIIAFFLSSVRAKALAKVIIAKSKVEIRRPINPRGQINGLTNNTNMIAKMM